ncbi:MAG: SDR family NAD(P)-dependent oxidoreductase [Alphaproteobacteria bacterium]|nr:SDR family NAD(P)-dependent oxidoreductase [Alphaproteobacteria bacterium]
MPTALITGANRGIGFGLARAFLADGWEFIAAVRDPANAGDVRALATGHPGKVSIEKCDLADFTTIDALGAKLKGRAIDLLLGNAAKTDNPANTIGNTDYDAWIDAFRINCMAQYKLAEVLAENVAISAQKKMFFISSRIGAKPPPGMVFFRSSKSALNQVVFQLSLMLKDRGITVACAHPGFVKTISTANMGVFTIDESAGYLKKIIDRLTMDVSGSFFEPDGSTLPIITRQMNPAAFGAKAPDAWAEQKKAWADAGVSI